MPGRGGQTTFSGTRYQAELTTLYLGRLVDPRPRGKQATVIEVRPEASAEAEVDDIVVRFADGHTEWMQAKESLANSGEDWQKCWEHFAAQRKAFQHPDDRIVLILGRPQPWSDDLREACSRAASAKSGQEWLEQVNKPQGKIIASLGTLLGDGQATDLYDLLRGVKVRVIETGHVREDRGPTYMPEGNLVPLDLYDKLLVIVLAEAATGRALDRSWLLQRLANEQVVYLVWWKLRFGCVLTRKKAPCKTEFQPKCIHNPLKITDTRRQILCYTGFVDI